MRRYEIWNQLLSQTISAVCVVEYPFELMEKSESGFPHDAQYFRRCMFRRDFKSSAHMIADKFIEIFAVGSVGVFVSGLMHREVVAYAAPDEAFLYFRKRVYRTVYVEKSRVVCVKIWTRLGMQAGWFPAFRAYAGILSLH